MATKRCSAGRMCVMGNDSLESEEFTWKIGAGSFRAEQKELFPTARRVAVPIAPLTSRAVNARRNNNAYTIERQPI